MAEMLVKVLILIRFKNPPTSAYNLYKSSAALPKEKVGGELHEAGALHCLHPGKTKKRESILKKRLKAH